MILEVSSAVQYIITHLYNKLPRRRVDMLGNELDRCIKLKCQDHWFPDQPMKGTAYRCLRVSGDHADSVMYQAARESGMDISEIFSCLPEDLTLWLDPGQVSYRIGEKGAVRILYSDSSTPPMTAGVPPAEPHFLEPHHCGGALTPVSPESSLTTPDFMGMFPPPSTSINLSEPVTPDSNGLSGSSFRPTLDNLSASFGQVTLYPGMAESAHPWSTSASPTNAPLLCPSSAGSGLTEPLQNYYLQKSTSTPNFTAASFAQTKFGSTKLKAPGGGKQRQNRLSPSEMMGNYMGAGGLPPQSQQSCVSPPSQPRPGVASPGSLPTNNFINRSMSLSPSVSQAAVLSSLSNSHNLSTTNSSVNGPSYDIPLILSPSDLGGDNANGTGFGLPPHLDPNFPMSTCIPAPSRFPPINHQFHSFATSSPEFSAPQFVHGRTSNSSPIQDPGADSSSSMGECNSAVDSERNSSSTNSKIGGREHESMTPGTPGYQQLLLAN